MKIPPYLQQGDTIAVIATARKISHEELKEPLEFLKSWGLNVVTGANIHKEQDQFAGSDAERCADLQAALDDKKIKAVIVARGGYGTMRLIDDIDFDAFQKNPKWIIGFSDITVLHSHIHQNFGIATLHGPMPLTFQRDVFSLETLRKALFGESVHYENIPSTNPNREGLAEGILIGGNLSLIFALQGSSSDIDTGGKILFLEDLDEYLYHVDRMMISLKRAGKLKNLKGLIVGGMSEMRDNPIPFGKSVYEIIMNTVKDYDYPVVFDFPAGHTLVNYALTFGKKIRLEVHKNSSSLIFE